MKDQGWAGGRVAWARVGAALVFAACQFDTDGEGEGEGSTADAPSSSTTTATADDLVDDTSLPIPQGPRRRRIELDPALVADVGGTTILVVLDADRIEYEDAQPDGSDLRFTALEGPGVSYPLEIERWDPSGRSFVWVRIDTAALPESLWMYYGGDEAEMFDPASVWDGAFAAVWHMALGEGSRVTDTTANALHLEPIGFTGTFDVAGLIGLATSFVPPAMPVEAGPLELEAGALALSDAFTIEAWVWSAVTTVDATSHVLRKAGAWELDALEPLSTRPRMELRTAAGTGPHTVEAGASLTMHEWTYLVATYRASDGMLALHRNGEVEGVLTIDGDPANRAVATNDAVVQLGRSLHGMLDEVRVSTIARSAAWIRLQHAAMRDQLLTFGPPEPLP
jgi:Concanavalin A-like lectin/glucanases superfamily